jgi:uncharacterized membrane protein YoaK (UPF0700 family)
MFRIEGAGHTDRQNRLLAGYLATVGGYVNSAGFILVGSFTSHVTGNVGRFANDVASGQWGAGVAAAMMITAFFVGSFVASMMVESRVFRRLGYAYAVALLAQASLLMAFQAISNLAETEHPRLKDMESLLLCAGMGMQNSLVTRLSGAVVRTTHLTGVVTDIGIEMARWFRWWRGNLSSALHLRLALGANPPAKPVVAKMALLVSIAGGFSIGAVLGATGSAWFPRISMVPPCAAVVVAGLYAFASGRASDRDEPPGSETDIHT